MCVWGGGGRGKLCVGHWPWLRSAGSALSQARLLPLQRALESGRLDMSGGAAEPQPAAPAAATQPGPAPAAAPADVGSAAAVASAGSQAAPAAAREDSRRGEAAADAEALAAAAATAVELEASAHAVAEELQDASADATAKAAAATAVQLEAAAHAVAEELQAAAAEAAASAAAAAKVSAEVGSTNGASGTAAVKAVKAAKAKGKAAKARGKAAKAVKASAGGKVGASSNCRYEELLVALSAAAKGPGVKSDPRYDALRALLDGAPTAGEQRNAFARSLVRVCVCVCAGGWDVWKGCWILAGLVLPVYAHSYHSGACGRALETKAQPQHSCFAQPLLLLRPQVRGIEEAAVGDTDAYGAARSLLEVRCGWNIYLFIYVSFCIFGWAVGKFSGRSQAGTGQAARRGATRHGRPPGPALCCAVGHSMEFDVACFPVPLPAAFLVW